MKKLNVMLAEDNPGDVFLVEEALREHGIAYQLFFAEDGEQAAQMVNAAGAHLPCPDIVLLDLDLPKKDGAAVLELLRRESACADAPVVVITSSDSPTDRRRVADLGIAHYFLKPADLSDYFDLGGIVRRIVDSSNSPVS